MLFASFLRATMFLLSFGCRKSMKHSAYAVFLSIVNSERVSFVEKRRGRYCSSPSARLRNSQFAFLITLFFLSTKGPFPALFIYSFAVKAGFNVRCSLTLLKLFDFSTISDFNSDCQQFSPHLKMKKRQQ